MTAIKWPARLDYNRSSSTNKTSNVSAAKTTATAENKTSANTTAVPTVQTSANTTTGSTPALHVDTVHAFNVDLKGGCPIPPDQLGVPPTQDAQLFFKGQHRPSKTLKSQQQKCVFSGENPHQLCGAPVCEDVCRGTTSGRSGAGSGSTGAGIGPRNGGGGPGWSAAWDLARSRGGVLLTAAEAAGFFGNVRLQLNESDSGRNGPLGGGGALHWVAVRRGEDAGQPGGEKDWVLLDNHPMGKGIVFEGGGSYRSLYGREPAWGETGSGAWTCVVCWKQVVGESHCGGYKRPFQHGMGVSLRHIQRMIRVPQFS